MRNVVRERATSLRLRPGEPIGASLPYAPMGRWPGAIPIEDPQPLPTASSQSSQRLRRPAGVEALKEDAAVPAPSCRLKAAQEGVDVPLTQPDEAPQRGPCAQHAAPKWACHSPQSRSPPPGNRTSRGRRSSCKPGSPPPPPPVQQTTRGCSSETAAAVSAIEIHEWLWASGRKKLALNQLTRCVLSDCSCGTHGAT